VLLGVDTGGTFTDFVLLDGERLRIHKVLSTPHAPEQAILQGIQELGIGGQSFHLVHGSTIATNAVLEGKGVRTAYITNRGFADVLTIGRQARRELYNLQPAVPQVPVPAELCIETGGRLAADGTVIDPLTANDCEVLLERLEELAPDAVAINLLFSFLDEGFERMLERRLQERFFVSRSSAILPEIREYERGIATWLNAWVGPRVEGYVQRLRAAVQPSPVHVMQSSGLTIGADQAARRAVNLLLSGPAGGLMGASFIGTVLGVERLLTFDMGGTSTDVALIDGSVNLTSEGCLGPWPVAVPMVDMHTIGAGGGSLAEVDEGGMLVVGPQSAGADPGPACYGRGGQRATVTDANLVLGRLLPEAFLGGDMRLDAAAAVCAVERLAQRLHVGRLQAAKGVVDLANEHMAQALRVISVQRGIDPAEFTLTAFGGAGGLHVCALAEALNMTRALVPMHAGVLSALGMLAAKRGRRLSHAASGLLHEQDEGALEEQFARLVAQGTEQLEEEGVDAKDIDTEFSLDLRYCGQSYTLNIPGKDLDRAQQDFHRLHAQRFGHRMETGIELVNLRVALIAAGSSLSLTAGGAQGDGQPIRMASLAACSEPVPVWRRVDLLPGRPYQGPLLVIDVVATTFVAAGWTLQRHDSGCLLLERA
jgi:N-methylhydantoinase A